MCVIQFVNVSELPKPEAGHTLTFTLEFMQKSENVNGYAIGSLGFYGDKGQRLTHYETLSSSLKGTTDWQERKLKWVVDAIPTGAEKFGVVFFLGKSTGKTYYSEPKLEVEVQ